MTVILYMDSGERHVLDRRYGVNEVAELVNVGRGKGKLIAFDRDLTPTGQKVWVDPDRVDAVKAL